MTWSIIARDHATGQLGIAVATRFFAVGARVPHIAARFGGIATQALINPYYGIDGLKLLREGRTPEEIIKTLIAADDGRESRQVHIMDAMGRIAAHTGRECVEWCGHIAGDAFSIAGNMLSGAAVLDDTANAYVANAGLPFAQRLIAAMLAGEAAGGDKRGKQSAALLIHGEEDGRRLTCASTTMPIRYASWNGSNRSAANAGCTSGNSCRPGRTRQGLAIAQPSTPASKPRLRASDDG